MSKRRISASEIEDLARQSNVTIQHDCGGYRVVKDGRTLFPDGMVCPTAPKREIRAFLKGFMFQQKDLR